MQELRLDVCDLGEWAPKLAAGDRVLLSGTVYTSRDAAHKRYFALLDEGKELPFDIKGAAIYYAGPTPTPPNLAIGSCGPTTSGRMDVYTPRLLDMGLKCMIGKGQRSKEVRDAIVRNRAVYFALAAKCIKKCEVIAFEDLGCESVKRLQMADFPLIVGVDCSGGNIFERKPERSARV